jgi:predicted deacylase
MLKVGSASAGEGSRGQGFIKVGEMFGHSEILIPVLIVNGKEKGPVLWINGGVHGDELNVFMAVRRVAAALDPGKLKGALVCTPVCNPLAAQWRHKLNPYDFLDLDQQFPGDSQGLISQRVAYHLFQEIKDKANFLINFHTAGTSYYAPPYTVYKVVPGVKPEVNRETEKIARAFGLYGNCRVDISTAKGELPGGMSGALDVNCDLRGIPAFMAEVGSGGKFEEENIATSEIGIQNVMKYLKMIGGQIEVPAKQITITKRRFLYCSKGGFLQLNVKPGEVLSKGDKIAEVIDLFSTVETLEAQEKTYVIQVRVNPVVHTGDRVIFFASEWEQVES